MQTLGNVSPHDLVVHVGIEQCRGVHSGILVVWCFISYAVVNGSDDNLPRGLPIWLTCLWKLFRPEYLVRMALYGWPSVMKIQIYTTPRTSFASGMP